MAAVESSRLTHYPSMINSVNPRPATTSPNPNICSYWLHGRCNRNPCKFYHPETTSQGDAGQTLCKFWASNTCAYGDSCRFLHSWHRSVDNKFSMLTRLTGGHKAAVTGIALPDGSNKLCTTAKDKTVTLWDCHTGKPVRVVNLGGEAGCLISEGSWVFAGLSNVVKAWRVDPASGEVCSEVCLDGPEGQVSALATSDDMVFAGVANGSILAWRCNGDGTFQVVSVLVGHGQPVVCLRVGAGSLFSGSKDGTIKVWDLKDLRCVHTLKEHKAVVTSLICWDEFLLSASLDRTVRVWGATETGELEVVYTHKEGVGIVSLFGMEDKEDKPVLYCSRQDNSVSLYDLPSFEEKGRIFANKEVKAIQQGPGGLFFTGDGTGVVSVWMWA